MLEKPLVFGVGINDADYKLSKYLNSKCVWTCPFYKRWTGMLYRCYSEKFKTNKAYEYCIVDSRWHLFSNFKAWMEQQDWEGKQLDKDLLVLDNKIYGPDRCLFIDVSVNKFIAESLTKRGEFPLGVCFDKVNNKYMAHGNFVITGAQKKLGRFVTPKEAAIAFMQFKLEQAEILALQQTDKKVASALINRYRTKLSALIE